MDTRSKNIKRQLIKARNDVRRKHRLIRANQNSIRHIAEKNAQPILEPLKNIAESLDKTLLMTSTAVDHNTYHHHPPQPEMTTVAIQAKDTTPPPPSPPSAPRYANLSFQSDDDDDDEETFSFTPDVISTQIQSSSSPYYRSRIMTTPKSVAFKPHLSASQSDPGINEMKKLIKTPEGQRQLRLYLGEVSVYGRPFVQWLLTGEAPDNVAIDTVYGPRIGSHGRIFMGDKEMTMDYDNIYVDGQKYDATEGLFNLLFLREPINYTPEDLNNYGDIIRNTNAARQGYSAFRPLKTNGHKYRTLLNRLVRPASNVGSGFKTVASTPSPLVDYIYWNDINELVDRLRLLFASKSAGNNSHTNEIESIIEELKEIGLIHD